MSLIIPPGFAHMAVQFLNNTNSQVPVITFGIQTDLGTGTPEGHCEAVFNDAKANFQNQITNDYGITGVRGVFGNDGPPIVASSTGPAVNGTRSGAPGAPQVAVRVTKQTAFGGRRYRGRMFMPGFLTDADDDASGRIAFARRNAIQIVMNTFLIDLATPSAPLPFGTPMYLLHAPSASGGPAPAPTLVETLLVRTVYGTQRSRLPRT